MRFADVDAVTVDGYGTLLRLTDPVPRLASALAERGWRRPHSAVEEAFRAEAAYYGAHALSARDAETLATLRRECAGVFLDALGVELPASEFADDFVGALVFEPLPGAVETLDRLAALGLTLAVVANWEYSLHDHLSHLGLAGRFAAVVISAEVGAAKPDRAPFDRALAELHVSADRAVHVGDDEVDERGAQAVGMRFLGAPLARAFSGWQ